MESFCKTEDCPSSEDLATSQDSDANWKKLSRHLSTCEFCTAEMELYRRFPPAPEKVEPAAIPQPLFELADALLHKKRDHAALYDLVEHRD